MSLSSILFVFVFFVFFNKSNFNIFAGIALTTFALSYGMWQMKTGNTQKSQKMMRLRIFGQGFTIIAILGGVLYASQKKSVKNS